MAMCDFGALIIHQLIFIRERKTHEHKETSGDCPRTGRVAKLCLCVLGHSLWGRRKTKTKKPRQSWDNPVKILIMCLFLRWFFCAPKKNQQFTCEVVSKGVFAESFAEILRKISEICGNIWVTIGLIITILHHVIFLT